MYRQQTVRFINFGSQAQQRTRQAFSRRNRFERFIMGVVGLAVGIPLLLLVLGLGVLFLLVVLGLGLFSVALNRLRGVFTGGGPGPVSAGRENVRVIDRRDRGRA